METIDIIMKLIEEKGVSQRELASYLGVNELTITNWKAKRAKSYLKYLPEIAIFFNVSVDYLLGKADEKNKPAENLSELDKNIINKINLLSPEKKRIALAQLEAMVNLELNNQDKA
jgi:transcriptional regulator with XRE-family HTH domain